MIIRTCVVRFQFFSVLAVACALGGCAASPDEGNVGDSNSEVRAAGAVTVENHATNPQIKSIQAEAARIDGLKLEQREACVDDDTVFTDAQGKFRKRVITTEGEDDFRVTTAYYNEAGHLILVVRRDVFVDHANGDEQIWNGTETRVYFNGKNDDVLVVVMRDAKATAPDPDKLAFGANRRATEEEIWDETDSVSNPAGC